MKLSVRELVFGAPRLLEWLGWSITKRPHLLGTPSQPICHPYTKLTSVNPSRGSIADGMPWLVCQGRKPAASTTSSPSHVLHAKLQGRFRSCRNEVKSPLHEPARKLPDIIITMYIITMVETGGGMARR